MKTKQQKPIFNSMRIIAGFFRWLAYYLESLLFFWLLPTFKRKFLGYSFNEIKPDLTRFGKLGMSFLGVRGELLNPHNIDLSKDYIITANHRSWLDQVSLVALYPRMIHFLAKAEYWKLPFLGRILENIECIPVTNKKLNLKAKHRLIKSLNANEPVCYYVEGTRGSGRELLPFKRGAFLTAVKFQKEILPIYILGTEQCLSKHRSMFDIRSGEIAIVIGKPVVFDQKNFEREFTAFEEHFNMIHNKLYDEFEMYKLMKAQNKTIWKLPSLNLV